MTQNDLEWPITGDELSILHARPPANKDEQRIMELQKLSQKLNDELKNARLNQQSNKPGPWFDQVPSTPNVRPGILRRNHSDTRDQSVHVQEKQKSAKKKVTYIDNAV